MGRPVNMAGSFPAAAPRQLQCQVQVPKDKLPGETITATTPDGQQLEVAVPMDAEPGATISFSYVPRVPSPAPTATVVGMPIGMMQMHGPHGGMGVHPFPELDIDRSDRQHSEIGWVLYCVGWALCLCCGPIGPFFWFATACMHWCRPKEDRERMPREHAMATVSLCTGSLGTALAVFLFLAMAATHHFHGQSGAGYGNEGQDNQDSNQDTHSHQNMHGGGGGHR